jgi:hypothetical protein
MKRDGTAAVGGALMSLAMIVTAGYFSGHRPELAPAAVENPKRTYELADRSSLLNIVLVVNVLARPGSALDLFLGIGGLSNSIAKPRTDVSGGSTVDLNWQQPPAPNNPNAAISSAPFSLQVRTAALVLEPSRTHTVIAADSAACALVEVNIYKADQPVVQTIPANLWRIVPPDRVAATMSAAPAGSFYRLTNVWNCGGIEFESGGSNECSSTGNCTNGAGPLIRNVQKSGKNLVITGSNFADASKILVNGEAQKTIYESATELTGKKLAKTTSRGAKIQVRNPDGSVSSEWTY